MPLSEDFIVDLHCHPGTKAFNSGQPTPTKNIWEKIHHRTNHTAFAEQIEKSSKQVLKESQCNLYSQAEGNVRVSNISLYPIEKGFLKLRQVPSLVIGKKHVDIMHEVILGFDPKRITFLKQHIDYYQYLQDEYRFTYNSQGSSPDGNYAFQLVGNFQELKALLRKRNTLAGIINIEGAHALGTVGKDFERLPFEEQKELLSDRIRQIKAWEFPPFSINLAHHFQNNLSGHAASFKMPSKALLNQNKEKDKGISPLGWHVVRELLRTENGKRILIDTKHMSALARREYYTFIENYNRLQPHNRIPIVFSHAGVNGFNTLENSIKQRDTPRKSRHSYLYKWSINISNDEARIIQQSGGVVGLMMDKGNLGGLMTIKEISSISDREAMRREFSKLFWDNAFQLVKSVGNEKGWDMVGLGTDFEGTITHMDPYPTSARLPLLFHDLEHYLEEKKYRKELWFGYTPTQLVKKIMRENALRFYEEFFV